MNNSQTLLHPLPPVSLPYRRARHLLPQHLATHGMWSPGKLWTEAAVRIAAPMCALHLAPALPAAGPPGGSGRFPHWPGFLTGPIFSSPGLSPGLAHSTKKLFKRKKIKKKKNKEQVAERVRKKLKNEDED